VSATFAFDVPTLEMLLVLPVIDEFRIDGDDEITGEDDEITGENESELYTPKAVEREELAIASPVAVTLFIDGDDELLYTP
jgi:hypothetical protein